MSAPAPAHGPASVPANTSANAPDRPADVPAAHTSFLAFDLGLKRTGVAVGNRITRTATPQPTLRAEGDARWPLIAQRIADWQPHALVVGVPFHPDGAAHEHTVRARKFARQLRGRFGLAVYEVDERYSTTEAHADIHAGRARNDADAVSAAIILEQFLRSLS
ncbi:MAG: Holliday junction resolvase RuvX [Pseudomonadota bacterium]|nr:Holliday junction resolvase RuvX [Pseudomonadota bacterium]